MATFSQLPGTLNLAFKQGDEVAVSIDLSINITGYTVAASIVSLVSGAIVETPTIAITDASAGTLSASLTESQTSAMHAGTYRWVLYWDAPGPARRTALEGMVEVVR